MKPETWLALFPFLALVGIRLALGIRLTWEKIQLARAKQAFTEARRRLTEARLQGEKGEKNSWE